MKILIAEPDFRFAQQAGAFLERLANLVSYENRSDKLLDRIECFKPDLLIIAAELATEHIFEQINAAQDRPAILLTEGLDRYDRAWQAWQNGGDELLLKPIFTTDDLHIAIVTALENRANPAGRQYTTAKSA